MAGWFATPPVKGFCDNPGEPLPKQARTKKQVRADKRDMKKLRDLGILSPRTDLRKAPTKHQRSKMRDFVNLLNGRAVMVRPKNPEKYKGSFEIIKGKVVVPKAKGERIKIDKAGDIVREKRIGKGRKSVSKVRVPKKPSDIVRPKNEAVIFKVPLRKGRHGEVEYRRFTYDGLQKFFAEYLRDMDQFDEWAGFIEEETIEFENAEALDDWEREHSMLVTGYVSTFENAKPSNSRKNIRRLRRDMRQYFTEGENE